MSLPSIGEPDRFEQFWLAYPRKVGKPDARKAFGRAMRKTDLETLTDGLRFWCLYWSLRNEPRFIPHPSTWLNQERWNDEPPPAESTNGGINALRRAVFNGTPRRAAEAIAPLVAITSGWDDDATRVYLAELCKLGDARILRDAATNLTQTWDRGWRPSLAEIITAYHAAARRLEPSRALPNGEHTCDYVRGIQIARDNYVAECRRQGRASNTTYFESMFNSALQSAVRRQGEG